MHITNIRLVFSKDDGGIRQSERQIIPELKSHGVNVVGVIVGASEGNYSDQLEDFKYHIDANPSNYKGKMYARAKSFVSNISQSRVVARKIHNAIASELESDVSHMVVINVRRISLIPVALGLAKLVNGNVIFHSGSSFNPGPAGINHLVYWGLRRHARLSLLANSKFSAQSYKLDSDHFMYPGVSKSRSSLSSVKENIRQKLGIPLDAPVFLYLARVNWDKAPDLLVSGFLTSAQANLNSAHLVIVGPIQDSLLKKEIDDIVCKHNAGERIHIVGKQLDVANWYAAADVFVNSRRGVEPFGISIVEAMSVGLPILTSALGGPSETVKDELNGWLVHNLTANGYRVAIDRAMLSKPDWKAYGLNSLRLSAEYSIEMQVKRYLKFCKRAKCHSEENCLDCAD